MRLYAITVASSRHRELKLGHQIRMINQRTKGHSIYSHKNVRGLGFQKKLFGSLASRQVGM